MRKYESYKPIEELWLTQIPASWEDIKIKFLFSERSEKGYPDEPLLVASQNMGVVPKGVYGNRTVEATKDLHLLKLVKVGDFVISLRSFQGGIEYAYYQGIISPAYTIMVPKPKIESGYFRYLAKSRLFIELLQLCVTGIREGQNIDYGKLKNHLIPVPPREEQNQIISYLDWQTSKINQLIDAKKRQIQVLREYALSACNELLTRGINPNVTFQPTGSNWMGEIPVHWKISKIAKHFTIKKRIAGKEGYDVLSITQQGLKVKDVSTNEGQIAANYSGYQFVYPGDFAMNHMDLLTGYIDISKHFGVTSPDYRVFVLDDTKNCYPEYYLQLFQLCYKRKIFYGYGRGAANQGRWRMPAVNFRSFEIPLPPYEEQEIISAKIQEINARIESACSKLESEIITLSEMKTRLISDVVTGQIDVRSIEVPDFELVEETADDADIDEDVNVEEEE